MAQAAAHRIGVVATNDVRYATPAQERVYDVLTCARAHATVDEIGRRLPPNGERWLKSPAEMAALFADCPAALRASRAIAERCAFTLADLGYTFPSYPVPPGETQQSYLEKMTWLGVGRRYPAGDPRAARLLPKVRKQVARELAIIGKLDLAGYFLVVWDIVEYARQSGIMIQGRGSAANSATCYVLGITAVDPVAMDLLFERFLSEERVQSASNVADRMPDIDLDLPSGDRREQVIQHVYAKYGARGAAMTANVITYRPRMAVRDTGRALGFSEEQLARISKHLPGWVMDDGTPLATFLAEAGFPATDRRTQLLAELATSMINLPRHLGQHSGGMVIAANHLDEVVPLEPASMPGRVIVQWDKDDCADLGIVKVDLLGLGMMAVLEEAVPLIQRHEGVDVDYGAPAGQRSADLRDAARRRHRRRVPGRIARADGDAAAHASRAFLRPGRRGRDHPPRADRRQDAEPLSHAARRPRGGRLPAPVAGADPGAHAGRAAVSGAADPHRHGRGGILRRPGRGAAARDGFQAIDPAHERHRGGSARRHGPERHRRAGAGRDRAGDQVVRALRLPRVARGVVRAARLRVGVFEGAPPGGVRVRAAQQLSDGLLSPGDAGHRRRPPRRRDPSRRRHALALAVRPRAGARRRIRDPPRA